MEYGPHLMHDIVVHSKLPCFLLHSIIWNSTNLFYSKTKKQKFNSFNEELNTP